MEVSLGQIFLSLIKYVPLIEKGINKFRPQMLNGIWCSCWQFGLDDQTYQLGTMKVRQLGKAVQAKVYSSSGVWNYKGTFEDDWLTARFGDKGGITGRINLEVSDAGRNTDKLKGTWTGFVDLPTENPNELERKRVNELPIFAARGRCVNYYCHTKKFQDGQGTCTKNV